MVEAIVIQKIKINLENPRTFGAEKCVYELKFAKSYIRTAVHLVHCCFRS